jgi:hypothetical protein
MQTELIENPLIPPTNLAPPSQGYPLNDETRATEEQNRLLLSWRAVLGEFVSGQPGGGQW